MRTVTVMIAGLLLGTAAQGQTRDFRSGMGPGIGYSGAIPHAELGVGAFHFVRSRVGVFAEAKMTVGTLKDHVYYCPPAITTCDVSWVMSERNDLHVRSKSEWRAFNAGAVYGLTRELAIFLGAGAAREKRFDEFFDDATDEEQERVTEDGSYYVPDSAHSGWRVQFVSGVAFRAGPRLAARFGFESAVKGASISLYIVP